MMSKREDILICTSDTGAEPRPKTGMDYFDSGAVESKELEISNNRFSFL